MAAYTSTQAGDFNTDATWGGGGHPTTAADTATINHAVTLSGAGVCGGFTIATGKTLTLADGASLTGWTAEAVINGTGELIVGAGCTVSSNSPSDIGIKCAAATGKITVTGTSGSRSVLTNAGAGGFYLDSGIQTLQYCDVHRGAAGTQLAAICAKTADAIVRGVGVDIEGTITGGYGVRPSYGMACNLRDSFISGCTAGLYSSSAVPGTFQLDNVDFTKDVAGNSQPNTTDITFARPVYIEGKGVRLGGGTTVTGVGTLLIADDFGHIAGDANPPGIGYIYDGNTGTIQRSTSAKNAGDYGARMTPNPSGTGSIHLLQPLEMEIRVPLQSGDSLTVSGTARKMAGTSMPAPSLAVRIDPEKSWFSTVNSWETTLPADGTFGSFSVASSGASGTSQKGSCRVVFRLKSGPASNDGTYVDIADVVATVTRATGGTVAYVFSMQNWQGGSPIADAPAVSTGGGGFVIMDA